MLRQLEPEQITKHWDEIKQHLKVGLLPFVDVADESMVTILESLLAGGMNAWVLFDDDTVYALATTAIIWEPVAMTKNLVLFSLSGYESVSLPLWTEAKTYLAQWAVQQGCKNIIAYSNVPGIVALAQREGANTQTHLLTWRL